MGRPAEVQDWEIVAAGKAIEQENGGKPVLPSTIRSRLGVGNSNRIREIWDTYQNERRREAELEATAARVLPPALQELLDAQLAEETDLLSQRLIAAYRAAEHEFTNRFAGERLALEAKLEAERSSLREQDELNDRYYERLKAVEGQLAQVSHQKEDADKRADALQTELDEARGTILGLQSALAVTQEAIGREVAEMISKSVHENLQTRVFLQVTPDEPGKP